MSRRSSSRNQASPGAATHTAICGAAQERQPGETRRARVGGARGDEQHPAASPHAQTRPMGSRCGGAAVIGLVSNSAAGYRQFACAPARVTGSGQSVADRHGERHVLTYAADPT